MDLASDRFGKGLPELRKERGWSRPEVDRKLGTSGAIAGRYQRGELTPSIEVAAKVAAAFRVTVSALVSGRAVPDISGYYAMLERRRPQRIPTALSGLLRSARAQQACAQTA